MFATAIVASELDKLGTTGSPVPVALSHELIQLLSDQLYQSPLKAIEELVVNSYDADALECRIFVEYPITSNSKIVIYDNGSGMNYAGLLNLWQVGRSTKRIDEDKKISKYNRKQIGKFGIGKLATYTIANNLTYITKNNNKILSVSVNYSDFSTSGTGAGKNVILPVHEIVNWSNFADSVGLSDIITSLGVKDIQNDTSWTLVVLENLKDKATKIKNGELEWVLKTAMPLKSQFSLYLNSNEIKSSKLDLKKIVEFDIVDLPQSRLENVKKRSSVVWTVQKNGIFSDNFKSGVFGKVIVTEKTLLGKSEDLQRSHGFFVRVRDRLVNDADPLFGLKPFEHGVFNRFRLDIEANDLDSAIKATRETLEDSEIKTQFRSLLHEIFLEATARYEKAHNEVNNPKREGERIIIPQRIFEYPIADVISYPKFFDGGSEADNTWFYLKLSKEAAVSNIVMKLYTERNKYNYAYSSLGTTSRMVEFNPETFTFTINQDHDFVKEYAENARSRRLLEDMVTAEVLLEVYLNEGGLSKYEIGDILEKRDQLFRGLAKDKATSLSAIAKLLRDSVDDEHELEIALVVAARALGFIAQHIAGGQQPDGIAKFRDYPGSEIILTLEAKSSEKTPSLSAIDVSGLEEHKRDYKAKGCLLIAPSYPGSSKANGSSLSKRAEQNRISCWTVEQLANFIENAEKKQLNARHLIDIVTKYYSPDNVTIQLNRLLNEKIDSQDIYMAIISSLRSLEGRVIDSPRTVTMLTPVISLQFPQFAQIKAEDVRVALTELSNASKGAMKFAQDNIKIFVSLDELELRLENLIGKPGNPRRKSNLRNND